MFQVVKGGAEKKLDHVVGALRSIEDELTGDDGVFGMQEQRLLRREMPLVVKPGSTVTDAELPEGGEPRRRITGVGARAG